MGDKDDDLTPKRDFSRCAVSEELMMFSDLDDFSAESTDPNCRSGDRINGS